MLAVALLACGWAVPAGAQDLEMHGYIEPCSVDNVREMYWECELCRPSPEDPQSCATRLGKRGYEKKCRTRDVPHSRPGDSAGRGEVWCVDTRRAKANARDPMMLWLAAVPLLLGGLLLLNEARSRRKPQK